MLKENKKLEKKLTLLDVYAISTGAMFSSGFFLLPGLAAAQTGSSVFLAYLVAGFLILPSMFSVAELSTAMPRAGGAYYFIDRSLGPLMGTIGGIGSWLALIFKSAFALIGMGAYIAIFIDLPIIPVALFLTVVFGILNVLGAKESTNLQKILVAALVTILAFYLLQGAFKIAALDLREILSGRFTPFFEHGSHGFLSTVGFVFVSYAGLTKVASVSEEVQNPDRNLPLGMILSLITASVVYVVGVLLMVVYLEPADFYVDLTPVASTGRAFMDWLPGETGLVLVVIAAAAAFASTGNAGILSASRYPFAMSRDRLVPERFSRMGRFSTPVFSVTATTLAMLLAILALDVESVAKLASAFQLLLFVLLNISVIVMRESRIDAYDPGFRSPWYPWMQIFGIFFSALLIAEMGLLSVLFTLLIVFVSVLWYFYYAAGRVERQGAIFHVHARLGQRRDVRLNQELRNIMREKGLRKDDPYEEVIASAILIDVNDAQLRYDDLLDQVTAELARRLPCSKADLERRFRTNLVEDTLSIAQGVSLNHVRFLAQHPNEMVLVRFKTPVRFEELGGQELQALIFLVSPTEDPARHLRILAHIAEVVEEPQFLARWQKARDEVAIKEILLRDERFITLKVEPYGPSAELIGAKVMEINLPGESLIAVIKRQGEIKIPHGSTLLHEGDELSIIGDVSDIEVLQQRFFPSQT